jgi:hypothetical protein
MTSKKWFIDADGNVDERVLVFVEELKNTILAHHPEATFELGPGGENPTAIFLDAYVDLDDPFEILDEISDRVVDIQVDEGIPLFVMPRPTPERAIEQARTHEQRRRGRWQTHTA